jgi:hypothetical protein
MAQQAAFSFDLRNLPVVESRMRQMADDWGVDVKFLCEDQARLWALDLVKKTGGDPGSSVSSQRNVQKQAMSGDIRNVFTSDGNVTEIRQTNQNENIVFFAGGGVAFLKSGDDVRSTGVGGMASIHDPMRTRRFKRVPRREPIVYESGKPYINKKMAKRTALNRYIRDRQKKIGTLKAGWLRAVYYYAGRTSGSQGSFPNWLTNNFSSAAGGSGHSDSMSRRGHGFLKAINTVPWSSDQIRQATISATGRVRQRDMMSKAERRKQRIVNQYNAILSR